MKEQQDHLQPEHIDYVIDGGELSTQDRPTTRLIQHLHTSAQGYAQENERSLDRIWKRMVHSQDHPVHLQAQWRQPEGKILAIKERKTMEDTSATGEMNSLASLPQHKKRRSSWRTLGISLVAAIAVITILSFTVFSGVLRPASQTAGNGLATITGAQPQKIISNSKKVCSFSAGSKVTLNGTYWSPDLSWSTQGQIAVSTYSDVKGYSAKDCASTFTQSSVQQAYGVVWSPDGKKLVVSDAGRTSEFILDEKGKIVTELKDTTFGERIWSTDSKKIIFNDYVSAKPATRPDPNAQISLKSVDISTGNKVATLFTLPVNSSVIHFAPDGKHAIVQRLNIEKKTKELSIWDIDTGKKIRDLAPARDRSTAFGSVLSPDGSLYALDEGDKVQIYTTVDGKLLTSFENKVTREGEHNFVWSPDGRYLAHSTDVIKIFDVKDKKVATTFGKVDDKHWITALTWSADGTGLASSAFLQQDGIPEAADNTVTVWQLS